VVEGETRTAEFDEGDDGNIGDERDDANTNNDTRETNWIGDYST
jgi:hypothetical protein